MLSGSENKKMAWKTEEGEEKKNWIEIQIDETCDEWLLQLEIGARKEKKNGARDALIKYRFRVFAVIQRILQLVAVIDCMRDRSLQPQFHLQLFVALALDDDTKPLDAQRQPVM